MACAKVTYSSFWLATTVLGKGSACNGTGAKPVGPLGYTADNGSLGATSNAPRTRMRRSSGASRAQWATMPQALLCATSTMS